MDVSRQLSGVLTSVAHPAHSCHFVPARQLLAVSCMPSTWASSPQHPEAGREVMSTEEQACM